MFGDIFMTKVELISARSVFARKHSWPSHVSFLDLDQVLQRAPTGTHCVAGGAAGNSGRARLPGSSEMELPADRGARNASIGRDQPGDTVFLADRRNGLLSMT
jgi:hypothetical protein